MCGSRLTLRTSPTILPPVPGLNFGSIWWWVGFNLFVLAMLAIDLGVFNRKAHTVGLKEAAIWTCVWVSLAFAFNLALFFEVGHKTALEFTTGYLIELSLSVDNIFVFLVLFRYFSVPSHVRHRVLFWGILGALIMRATMILAGVLLLQQFEWLIYVFGAFLIYTGYKMFRHGDMEVHPEHNPVLKLLRKVVRIGKQYHGGAFFAVEDARIVATPLLVVLVMIETTDVIFALDSIPAIFAVTRDPLVVYTSNIFAILGLRSMFFLLSGVMDRFVYLKTGLAIVLSFVGVKMVISDIFHISIGVSLAVVALVLATSILASLRKTAPPPAHKRGD
jgi:tellurite resistance protein TerC